MRILQRVILAIASFILVIGLSNIALGADNLELLASQLKYETGKITLQSGVATVNVPAELRYLNSQQTQIVLEKIWGNPSGDGTLGMLVPAKFNPLSKNSWGVVITYQEDGYVKDDEAESIDYSKLLKTMQEATKERNEQRVKQGYPAIEIVGWAKQPSYDKVHHQLHWAKDFKVSDSDEHTLNYNIRVLGRKGVLVLNAVAGLEQLSLIEKDSPKVLSSVAFNPGYRYEDFNPNSDKIANYGIAALVAGGVAVKTGLFKGILLALLAAKKFLIIAVVVVIAFIQKIFGNLFGRKRQNNSTGNDSQQQ
ncbi:DUF2167 domain-containing protein [Hassallia byssoidea VB512170]|uniref:DUF2167 domain-containing protein n=1 Tax=Hassallia byssoidea VB512170 TaxID=1304833 RepID=A0A846H017_9CYAN|nr:DUF2167 domain-containing protein [Hassalia byssoidea]NEU71367.1 DUF2167 domain-containing protein [Hassalia byssoidea VB512170]